ncbi:MAG: Ig-like domain-containing protein [Candidatus Kerfeldbacteria bacterium]
MKGAPIISSSRWKKALAAITGCLGFFLVSVSPALAQVNTAVEGIALSDRSPVEAVLYIISWVLGILAIIAVIIVIWGGVTWMTSGGNEEKIDRAKKILINGSIGLVIILAAWGIVLYVLSVLSGATGAGLGGDGNGQACVGCTVPGGGSEFYVLATNPEAGETDVTLCTDVTVLMNADVDQATVTNETLYVQVEGGGSDGSACTVNTNCASAICSNGNCQGDSIPGVRGFAPGESTAYFNFIPDNEFEANTVYQAVVMGGSGGVLSEDSNDDQIDDRLAMTSSYIWTFTTGNDTDTIPPTVQENSSSPFPADGETDVCTNTVINFDFSESMRITTFNDTLAYVLDSAGTQGNPADPDWSDTRSLRGWSFGGNFDYAQVRPSSQLDDYSLYSTRLYAGDPNDNFLGALTDSCGNPLDGDGDGTAEGDTVDNYYGYDPGQGESEEPITWETGENAECTPVVESISPLSDYYGEYAGKREGEACGGNAECGSGSCTNGTCEGYGPTTLMISGLYLAPHPEVMMEGSELWASDSFNTCFDQTHLGNVTTNTAVGDACLDDDLQSTGEILMRTIVGARDTSISVSVAGEQSDPSDDQLEILSPYIASVSPSNGSIGQYVTLSGENFGEATGTVLMRSSDGVRQSTLALPEGCGDVWDPEEVVAIIPDTYTDQITGAQGNWETDNVAYIQLINAENGLYSDLQEFTFSDVVRPNLCSIAPSCDNAAGTAFTITGENFNASQGDSEAVFTSESDPNTGYYGAISNWSDSQIDGSTDGNMGQDEYWVTVYDAETELSSNGRGFDIPCHAGPSVFTINSCNENEGIYPVPNPRPNEDEACINANVAVLFDQEMDTGSLTTDNIFLKQYNSGASYDSAFPTQDVSGHFDTVSWSVDYQDSTYYGFQFNIDQSIETDPNGDPTGNTSQYLQPDTWYELTISTGVKNTDGVNMGSTYTMHFHTDDSGDVCDVSSVSVQPSSSVQNAYWDAQAGDRSSETYTGSAYDADCNILDPNSYAWDWAISDTSIGDFGPFGNGELIDSSNIQDVYVAGNDVDNEGRATVSAGVDQTGDDAFFTVDLAFCQSNDDCALCTGSTCNFDTSHCTPVINNFSPSDGDHGTWVAVNGCMFGSQKGSIFWNSVDGAIAADTAWPDSNRCGDTWTGTQIIAEVPAQYDSNDDGTADTDLPEQDYNIEVETTYGDSYVSVDAFTVNATERPGICSILPNYGEELDSVVIQGQSLGGDEGLASFLDDPNRVSAEPDFTNWEPSAIATRVAIGAVTGLSDNGMDGFRAIVNGAPDDQCSDDSFCSEAMDFTVTCDHNFDCATGCCSDSNICAPADTCLVCETDEECVANGQCPGSVCDSNRCTPIVNALSPATGPAEGPVTVQGCYFGTYNPQEGSVVSFGVDSANILCANGWSNTQIIAEVPAVLSQDPSDVTVTTRYGNTSNSSQFTLSNVCSNGAQVRGIGVPILCDLSPGTGRAASDDDARAGATIFYTGTDDRYIDGDTQDIFYDLIIGNNFQFLTTDVTTAEVGYGSATGDATVQVNACSSNGLQFGIECTQADIDCGPGQYCIDNLCTDNPCGGHGCNPATEEADCGAASGCYFENDPAILEYCCASQPTLISSNVSDGDSDLCPNASFRLTFSESMMNLDAIVLQKYDDVTETYSDVLIGRDPHLFTQGTPETDDDEFAVRIKVYSGLDTDAQYRLLIQSTEGEPELQLRSLATALTLLNGDQQFVFTTAPNSCVPTSIQLRNDETDLQSHTFTEPNGETSFTAHVYASNGAELAQTDEIDWTYAWDPYYDENRCNNVAWVNSDASQGAEEESQPIVSGTENNAIETLSVTVSAVAGWGGSLNDTATLSTFFCDPNSTWEYVDEVNGANFHAHNYPQHFRLIYCADNGLPEMDRIVVNDSPGLNDDWFLQYLFINSSNEDQAFAVRVFPNNSNLTPEAWYEQNVPTPGSPGTTTVDGYEAVRDGSSYYIGASNIDDDTNGDGIDELYNNIYLLTFNDEDQMDQIASQIIDFFTFNMNISYEDCDGSDKYKLVRDTKRVTDLGTIAGLANDYYDAHGEYPEPQSQNFGSYISELTTSVWNSWQGALGNLFGATLPEDPYNFFYASIQDTPWEASATPWISDGNAPDCEYDPDNNIYWDEAGTCWDPVNNLFFCPVSSHVYMWKRSNANDAYLYGNFEYESTATEDYIELNPLSASPCQGISNASCPDCFDYEISSVLDPGGDWD